MQPCQALITSPDVLNKILPGKPGAVHIEVRVLDHVIVGEGVLYSFAEHGMMPVLIWNL